MASIQDSPDIVNAPLTLASAPAEEAYAVEFVEKPNALWFDAILYLYGLVVLPYLAWRLTIVNTDVWYGPALYAAELYGVVTTFLFLWMTRKVSVPVHREAVFDTEVDVLICTYKEPLTILEPTVYGAIRVRGVSSVLVLDDGNRPEVREMAERLGVRYYPRSTNEHAKAGNLNNGLRHSTAEFLLVLDADHVPAPHFLERTLGYFDDADVAFVQTPQTYHNRDSFLFRRTRKGWWSEQGMFYDCIQPAKNRWNSAFFVGTSALMRRDALEEIGGFATGTATEDIHTSLRLHARRWKSVFVPEALAFGLEAENLKEFYRQRRRWAAGSLGLMARSPDSPLWCGGLTLHQRLNYLSATLAHAMGAQRILFFLTPLLCTLSLAAPVSVDVQVFLPIFGGFLAIGFLGTLVYARGTYHPLYTEAYSLANAVAHCAGMRGMVRVQKKFAVSRKSLDRHEQTWVRTVLWVLLGVAVVGVARAAILLAEGTSHESLLIASLVVGTFNACLLGSFLVYLVRYERRPPIPYAETAALAYVGILRKGQDHAAPRGTAAPSPQRRRRRDQVA